MQRNEPIGCSAPMVIEHLHAMRQRSPRFDQPVYEDAVKLIEDMRDGLASFLAEASISDNIGDVRDAERAWLWPLLGFSPEDIDPDPIRACQRAVESDYSLRNSFPAYILEPS